MYSATALAVPGFTTYQAKIVKPDGTALEAVSVNFRFTVLNPAADCVLYIEDYSAVNMAGSNGLISFSLGSGTKAFPTSGSVTFKDIFNNSNGAITCLGSGNYIPASNHTRKIVMQFHDAAGWQTLPPMSINAVPYSMFATKADDSTLFNNKADTAFVQYTSIPTCTASTTLTFNGASFSCITGAGGGASGTITYGDVTTALGYTPVSAATLSASFTTVATSYSTVTATVSSLGTSVTAIASTVSQLSASMAALSGGGISLLNGSASATQTFSMSSIGSAPAVVTLNGVHNFRFPNAASSTITAGLISNADYVSFSNKVSTASFTALTSSVLTNAASITANTAAISSLAVSTAASFASLSVSGIGSLNGSTSATQTFSVVNSGSAPAIVSSNGVHSFRFPFAASSTVTAGLLSNLDYLIFSNKMNATSAAVNTALGYTAADAANVTAVSASLSSLATSTAASFAALSGSGIGSLNGSSSATQTFANGSTGLQPGYVTANGIHTLNIPNAASNSVTGGLLSNADYVTFVNHGSSITTLSSDIAAVSSSVNSLSANKVTSSAASIAQVLGYIPAASGSVGAGGVTSVNGSTSATQTFTNGTTGNNPNYVTANGVHTLNIPYASVGTTTAGLISNFDFTTFTNKITSSAVSIAQVLGYVPADAVSVTTLSSNVAAVSASLSSFAATTAASFSAIAGSGISTFNSSTSATQSLANALTGSQPTFITANGVHTLNIPYASTPAVAAGLISYLDYANFSNKITSSAVSIAQVLGYTPAASGSFSLSPASIAAALGYTPGDAASVTTLISNVAAVSAVANSKITSSAASVAEVLGYVPSASGSVSVTSASIATALGYTPGDAASVTTLTANLATVSAAANSAQVGVAAVSASLSSFAATTAASFSAIAGTGISTLNGSTSATQSFGTGTTGNNPNYVTANGVHTLNIPFASAATTTAGLISFADFTTFTNKITSSAVAIAQVLGYTPADAVTVAAVSSSVATKITSSAASVAEVLGYIPAASGSLGVGGIASFNGSTSATQTFASALTGSQPTYVSANGVHTLNIPYASTPAVAAGLISYLDYTNFSNKITSSAVSIAQVLGYTPAASGSFSLSPASIAAALGYTPGDAASVTTLISDVAAVSAAVNSVSSTVATKITSSAASIAQTLGYVPAASGSSVSSQWTTSGPTIFYNTGNVGLGVSIPVNKLDVAGTINVTGGSIITNGWLQGANVIGATYRDATTFNMMSFPGANSLAFTTASIERLRITSGGAVGINTTTPITMLDVSGGIRISMESATCAASYAGTLRYNGSSVEYCNGSSWAAFGVAGAGITNFNGSTSSTQTLANALTGSQPTYVTANGVHTLNIPYASTPSVVAGLISYLDYANFSNKITSSAASIAQVLGYIPSASGSVSVTSASIATALGYTPGDAASVTTLFSNVAAVSAAVNSVSSTVATKITSSAASIAEVLGYVPANTAGAGVTKVRAATLADITLSGLQTIDGVSLSASDRVLVKNQTVDTQNGVYVASAGAWTRAADLDAWSELLGYEVTVTEGDYQSGLRYSSAVANGGTIGSTSVIFNTQGTTRLNRNIAMGENVLAMNNSGTDNVAIGANSMKVTTGATANVAVGANSMQNITGGYWNAALGMRALRDVTIGTENVAIGYETLKTATTGAQNTAVGKDALKILTTGNSNVALGLSAGSAITTGSYNVVLGSNTGSSIATAFNNIIISDGQANIRAQFVQNGNLGLGTTTPITKLDVSGGIRISMEAATCAASYAGTLRYNGSAVEYCDGSTWAAFGVAGSGITNFNGSTSSTQTLANALTGSQPTFVMANGVHTLNIPYASTPAVTAGLISSLDFTNFSNKITSSAAAIAQVLGYVPSASGSVSVTSSSITAALGYTAANAASVTTLIADVATVSAAVNTISSTVATKITSSAASIAQVLGYVPAASGGVSSQWTTSGTSINYMTGNVGVGTTNPAATFAVSGSTDFNAINAVLPAPGSGGSSVGNNKYTEFTANSNYATSTQFIYGDKATVAITSASAATDLSKLYLTGISHVTNYAAAASTTQVTGTSFRTDATNAGAVSLLNANSVLARLINSNAANGVIKGMSANTTISGAGGSTGSASDVYGVDTAISLNSGNATNTFAIGNAYGVRSSVGVANTSSGSINAAYGMYIDSGVTTNASNGGTINNQYGLFIEDQNLGITNKWNIFSQGANSKNYFEGKVGIGEFSPSAFLHVGAGTSSSAAFKFTSGTLLTSPQPGSIEYDGADYFFTDGASTRRSLASIGTSGLTSAAITSVLGYTPGNASSITTLTSSLTTVISDVATVSASVNTISSTVATKITSSAASIAQALGYVPAASGSSVSSQWLTSGTAISYSTGFVGIGTSNPTGVFEVQGGAASAPTAMTMVGQTGNNGNTAGGAINITAGAAYAPTLRGIGGAVNITGGAGAGIGGNVLQMAGGQVLIRGGAGASPGGKGGTAQLNGGAGGAVSGTGGAASVVGGNAVSGTGGLASVTGGTTGEGIGGGVNIGGGNAGTGTGSTYNGGNVTIAGGIGIGNNSSGGNITLTSGDNNASSAGYVLIKGGDGNSGSKGNVYLQDAAIAKVGIGKLTSDVLNSKLDVSGDVAATNGFLSKTQLTATAGSGNYGSQGFAVNSSVWNGSAAETTTWNFLTSITSGVNATSDAYLSYVGSDTLLNSTLTVLGHQHSSLNSNSPIFKLAGWQVAAGPVWMKDSWEMQNVIGAGFSPTSTFAITHTGSGAANMALMSGNFGIGTTSPTAALHLKAGTSTLASLKFTSGTLLTTPQSGTIEYDGASFYVTNGAGTRSSLGGGSTLAGFSVSATAPASGQVLTWNASTNSWAPASAAGGSASPWVSSGTNVVFNTGNVGMGASNPARRLEVFTVAAASGAMALRTADYNGTTTGSTLNFDFGATSGDTNSVINSFRAGGTIAHHLSLQMNGGFVGIGTSIPTQALDVAASVRSRQTLYEGKVPANVYSGDSFIINESTNTQAKIRMHNMNSGELATDGFGIGMSGAGADVTIMNYEASTMTLGTSGVAAMTFLSNGYAGFGTTTPANRLHVLNMASATALATTTDSSGTTFQNTSTTAGAMNSLLFKGPTYESAAISMVYNTSGNVGNKLVLQTKSSSSTAWNANQLVLSPMGGFVGIGVSAPTVALDVNGDIQYTGTITDASDRRLKDNIEPLGSGLARIRKMQTYSYVMKDDPKKRTEFGVIAQDMLGIIPELVSVIKGDFYGVNYVGLVPWSIRAIQEVDSETQNLRRENQEIKRELASMKEHNQVLEQKLEKILQALEQQKQQDEKK
ncbi:hypothetical protein CIK05_04215 [Bdellovibrio sp. qaytius]|nr:hypothetical protein CIK05_04215 [Bdellovibrio sp. qaytius]